MRLLLGLLIIAMLAGCSVAGQIAASVGAGVAGQQLHEELED